MAALDLITLAEGRDAINVPQEPTATDAEAARFITAVSLRIDDICGPVVRRAVTGEQHDGGRHQIALHVPYATSASSVIEYDHTTATTLTAETNAIKPADGYLLDPVGRYGELVWLRRRCGSIDGRFPHGRRNVEVSYTAGRAADTSAVPVDFKVAAGSILRRLWQRDQGAWARAQDPFDTGGAMLGFYKAVDPMVHEFLGDHIRTPAVA